jgi:hypothetical protein
MTDKEVGELWREVTTRNIDQWPYQKFVALIRKLVEERAKWLGWLPNDVDRSDALASALRDFGIDPDSWT